MALTTPIRCFALLLCLALPDRVMAEREVHMVSIAYGTRTATDMMGVPEARVHVDRPDQLVTLVVIDRGPLR